MKTYEGKLNAEGLKVALVVSRFNDFITEKLLAGAVDTLQRHGVKESGLSVYRVPGSFELPVVAAKVAQAGGVDAVICLGAVIRGGTPHFDYVAGESAKGVAKVAMESKVPVIYGVVTTDTIEQAVERAGTKMGNRGADAAMSAIEMAQLYRSMGK